MASLSLPARMILMRVLTSSVTVNLDWRRARPRGSKSRKEAISSRLLGSNWIDWSGEVVEDVSAVFLSVVSEGTGFHETLGCGGHLREAG